jgi:outer membrane beta-barrel protein
MLHMHRLVPVSAALLVSLAALGGTARAQDKEQKRVSPLEGQPAVRHRLLLVKQRVEIEPAFESSVNADFRHTESGGLKLEYHLTDMWSFGGVAFFGAGLNTGLNNKIQSDLPDSPTSGDPTPSKDEWSEHLNDIPVHGAGYLTVTPWYGKLAAFGKFFVNFDFYFSGGIGFAQLKNAKKCCSFTVDSHPGEVSGGEPPDNNPNNDKPLNEGFKPGGYLGGGIHLFVSNWAAIDLTVRSYIFQDNPSGLDFNADLAVTKDDNRIMNHLFMGAGVSFFLPGKVKRTP